MDIEKLIKRKSPEQREQERRVRRRLPKTTDSAELARREMLKKERQENARQQREWAEKMKDEGATIRTLGRSDPVVEEGFNPALRGFEK